MAITEEAMRFLEEHIPEQAEMALKQAYWKALASGSTVLICENGVIMEVHPDGTRKTIKKTSPPTPVTPGQRLEIK